MKTIKEHFHIIIIIILVLLLSVVAYYFLYELPKFNNAKLELEEKNQEALLEIEEAKQNNEEEEELLLTQNLNNCLSEAEAKYNRGMEFLFQNYEEPECKNSLACLTVNLEKQDEIKIDLKDDKEECFKLYDK